MKRPSAPLTRLRTGTGPNHPWFAVKGWLLQAFFLTPKVSLRQALEDPSLLGTALAGPSWHAWRSLLLATMGESLNPDETDAFIRIIGRPTPPPQRFDELWCCVGRRGGKSRGMAVLATYLAGLYDYSDKLSPGERGVRRGMAP